MKPMRVRLRPRLTAWLAFSLDCVKDISPVLPLGGLTHPGPSEKITFVV